MELEDVREEVREELLNEEKKQRWFGLLALTTVALAVCATLSSFKEGNNSVDSVLNQTQASDQWSYYQSKSIKGYLYEMQKQKLELELKASGRVMDASAHEEYEKIIDDYDKNVRRYDEEKKQIMNDAKTFEKLRDESQRRAASYGIAVIFLQMGILLCSLSALMKKKLLWLVGSVVGVIGVVYFADGMFLFFK